MNQNFNLHIKSKEYLKILQYHFGDQDFEVTVVEKINLIFFSMNYQDGRENNNCFNLSIKDNKLKIETIKYPNETNCLINGSDILKKLFYSAKDMQLDYIELVDTSVKYIGNGDCSYKLFKHYILVYGYSWYNKFGYYSEKYQIEIKENFEVRNKTLDFYRNNHQKVCDDLLSILNKEFLDKVDYETAIYVLMQKCDMLLKKIVIVIFLLYYKKLRIYFTFITMTI